MSKLKPTAEQQAAIDVFATGDNLVLEAGAGTGKTSTLKLLAEVTSDRGLYIAYNRAIADEAGAKFPSNVQCRTAHSLAYRAIGHEYQDRLGGGYQPWWKVSKALGFDGPLAAGDRVLSTVTLARLTMEMVSNFCNSADEQLRLGHRPYVDGLVTTDEDGEKVDYHGLLGEYLLPHALKAWEALQDPRDVDSPVKFSHDHYLKLWQLSKPRIKAEYILFDEAQDANPVIADIVAQQTDTQVVAVGDRAQAIYGWRGAVDFMDSGLPGAERRFLSQSWRFGQVVADNANLWLEQLDTPLRLTGNPGIDSVINDFIEKPRAILCRSNAGALQALINAQAVDQKAHLVGGATDIGKFCDAAVQLQTTGKTFHRDLIAFSSWDEVVEYVKESKASAGDLGTWVNILERHGVETVRHAVSTMTPENLAEVTISTAHKAKGREWDSVRIADDFAPRTDKDGEPLPLSSADIMLRYVAVTRAKLELEPGVLKFGAPTIDRSIEFDAVFGSDEG
jgi:superfamily I DNA/RNA helicase